MSEKEWENPFTKGSIQFIVGPKKPKLASFDDIHKTFRPIRSTSLVEGDNYLLFSKGGLSPSYNIVRYLRRDEEGNIIIKELFGNHENNNSGWYNVPKLMTGSRHYKEEKVYRPKEIFTNKEQYDKLSSYEKKNIHIFRSLGERASEFNEEMDDKEATDIIEELVAEKKAQTQGTASGKKKSYRKKSYRKKSYRKKSYRKKSKTTKKRK